MRKLICMSVVAAARLSAPALLRQAMAASHVAPAAVLCGLALQGCAIPVQEDWHDRPTHPALPPFYFELAAADLESVCGHQPKMRTYGCALRLVEEHACAIFTEPEPPQWLLTHERMHCAGWDHS